MVNSFRIPVIQSVQGGQIYYSGVVTYKQLIELFVFNEEDDDEELKAQRSIKPKRAKEIADYIIKNAMEYVIPPVIATVGHEHDFNPIDEASGLGFLIIPEGVHVYLCDGQHRREGIKEVLKIMGADSELMRETVPVTFYVTEDVERERQIFADINGTPVKIPKSLLGFFEKNPSSDIARKVMANIPFVNKGMELQKTSLTKTSQKMFTFNTFSSSIGYLIDGIKVEKQEEYAIAYWNMLCKHIPLWVEVKNGTKKAPELRENTLITHGVMVQALGLLGANIFKECFVLNKASEKENLEAVDKYVSQLADVDKVDFYKGNTDWSILWDGGRVKTASDNQKLASIYLGILVGLGLSPQDKSFCELKKAHHLVKLWREKYPVTTEQTKAPETTPAPTPTPIPSTTPTKGAKGRKKRGGVVANSPLEDKLEEKLEEYLAEQSGIPQSNIVVIPVTDATTKSYKGDIPKAMQTQTEQDLYILLNGGPGHSTVMKVRSIITTVKGCVGQNKDWRKSEAKKTQVKNGVALNLGGYENILDEVMAIILSSTDL
jgi:DNA sulfur modification protein DndB